MAIEIWDWIFNRRSIVLYSVPQSANTNCLQADSRESKNFFLLINLNSTLNFCPQILIFNFIRSNVKVWYFLLSSSQSDSLICIVQLHNNRLTSSWKIDRFEPLYLWNFDRLLNSPHWEKRVKVHTDLLSTLMQI